MSKKRLPSFGFAKLVSLFSSTTTNSFSATIAAEINSNNFCNNDSCKEKNLTQASTTTTCGVLLPLANNELRKSNSRKGKKSYGRSTNKNSNQSKQSSPASTSSSFFNKTRKKKKISSAGSKALEHKQQHGDGKPEPRQVFSQQNRNKDSKYDHHEDKSFHNTLCEQQNIYYNYEDSYHSNNSDLQSFTTAISEDEYNSSNHYNQCLNVNGDCFALASDDDQISNASSEITTPVHNRGGENSRFTANTSISSCYKEYSHRTASLSMCTQHQLEHQQKEESEALLQKQPDSSVTSNDNERLMQLQEKGADSTATRIKEPENDKGNGNCKSRSDGNGIAAAKLQKQKNPPGATSMILPSMIQKCRQPDNHHLRHSFQKRKEQPVEEATLSSMKNKQQQKFPQKNKISSTPVGLMPRCSIHELRERLLVGSNTTNSSGTAPQNQLQCSGTIAAVTKPPETTKHGNDNNEKNELGNLHNCQVSCSTTAANYNTFTLQNSGYHHGCDAAAIDATSSGGCVPVRLTKNADILIKKATSIGNEKITQQSQTLEQHAAEFNDKKKIQEELEPSSSLLNNETNRPIRMETYFITDATSSNDPKLVMTSAQGIVALSNETLLEHHQQHKQQEEPQINLALQKEEPRSSSDKNICMHNKNLQNHDKSDELIIQTSTMTTADVSFSSSSSFSCISSTCEKESHQDEVDEMNRYIESLSICSNNESDSNTINCTRTESNMNNNIHTSSTCLEAKSPNFSLNHTLTAVGALVAEYDRAAVAANSLASTEENTWINHSAGWHLNSDDHVNNYKHYQSPVPATNATVSAVNALVAEYHDAAAAVALAATNSSNNASTNKRLVQHNHVDNNMHHLSSAAESQMAFCHRHSSRTDVKCSGDIDDDYDRYHNNNNRHQYHQVVDNLRLIMKKQHNKNAFAASNHNKENCNNSSVAEMMQQEKKKNRRKFSRRGMRTSTKRHNNNKLPSASVQERNRPNNSNVNYNNTNHNHQIQMMKLVQGTKKTNGVISIPLPQYRRRNRSSGGVYSPVNDNTDDDSSIDEEMFIRQYRYFKLEDDILRSLLLRRMKCIIDKAEGNNNGSSSCDSHPIGIIPQQQQQQQHSCHHHSDNERGEATKSLLMPSPCFTSPSASGCVSNDNSVYQNEINKMTTKSVATVLHKLSPCFTSPSVASSMASNINNDSSLICENTNKILFHHYEEQQQQQCHHLQEKTLSQKSQEAFGEATTINYHHNSNNIDHKNKFIYAETRNNTNKNHLKNSNTHQWPQQQQHYLTNNSTKSLIPPHPRDIPSLEARSLRRLIGRERVAADNRDIINCNKVNNDIQSDPNLAPEDEEMYDSSSSSLPSFSSYSLDSSQLQHQRYFKQDLKLSQDSGIGGCNGNTNTNKQYVTTMHQKDNADVDSSAHNSANTDNILSNSNDQNQFHESYNTNDDNKLSSVIKSSKNPFYSPTTKTPLPPSLLSYTKKQHHASNCYDFNPVRGDDRKFDVMNTKSNCCGHDGNHNSYNESVATDEKGKAHIINSNNSSHYSLLPLSEDSHDVGIRRDSETNTTVLVHDNLSTVSTVSAMSDEVTWESSIGVEHQQPKTKTATKKYTSSSNNRNNHHQQHLLVSGQQHTSSNSQSSNGSSFHMKRKKKRTCRQKRTVASTLSSSISNEANEEQSSSTMYDVLLMQAKLNNQKKMKEVLLVGLVQRLQHNPILVSEILQSSTRDYMYDNSVPYVTQYVDSLFKVDDSHKPKNERHALNFTEEDGILTGYASQSRTCLLNNLNDAIYEVSNDVFTDVSMGGEDLIISALHFVKAMVVTSIKKQRKMNHNGTAAAEEDRKNEPLLNKNECAAEGNKYNNTTFGQTDEISNYSSYHLKQCLSLGDNLRWSETKALRKALGILHYDASVPLSPDSREDSLFSLPEQSAAFTPNTSNMSYSESSSMASSSANNLIHLNEKKTLSTTERNVSGIVFNKSDVDVPLHRMVEIVSTILQRISTALSQSFLLSCDNTTKNKNNSTSDDTINKYTAATTIDQLKRSYLQLMTLCSKDICALNSVFIPKAINTRHACDTNAA